ARHVDKLGVRSGVAAGEFRLERHTADRAGARTDLPDLRVHRAGIDRAFGDGLRLAQVEILLRIAYEFRPAAGRAEIIGMALIIGAVRDVMRIDRHVAHGIDRAACRCMVVMTPVVMLCRHACTLSPIPPGGIYRSWQRTARRQRSSGSTALKAR